MKKEHLEFVAITTGVIILIFVVKGNLKSKPPERPGPKAVSSASATSGEAAVSKPGPAPIDAKMSNARLERTKADWGRDPFAVSTDLDKEYNKIELQLKGISLTKEGAGFAFINNEIVKKGDRIGDYEIMEIEKNQVMVRRRGQSFYLVLPTE